MDYEQILNIILFGCLGEFEVHRKPDFRTIQWSGFFIFATVEFLSQSYHESLFLGTVGCAFNMIIRCGDVVSITRLTKKQWLL